MSLRLRLTLFFTLFLAIVLTVAASAVYALTQRSLMESVADRAEQALRDLQEQGYAQGARTLPGDAYYIISFYLATPTSWDVLPQGTPFDGREYVGIPRNDSSTSPHTLLASISDAAFQELFSAGEVTTVVQPEDNRQILLRARAAEINNFPAVLIIGFPIATDTLTQLQVNLVRTVMSAFIIFALGVWLLSHQVLRPVKWLTQAAAGVSGQDLSQRVPVPSTRDEVSELAITLNHMLGRLQESFETQRRFTADASHELRTPVTAITGHINYLLRRTQPSPEQVDSLKVIKGESERMGKLVNDLLELARADAGFIVDKRPMNLVEVVESVHMEVAPVAGQATIDVSMAPKRLEIIGDASRLKQVLLNLVHNALNAGSSHVAISVSTEKKSARLEILDNGPGIPEEAIPHLFERFYRVDGARSTRGNGSGLGLAIVKWIVDQHGGEVMVDSRIGEGTVFTVLLPLVPGKQSEVKTQIGLKRSAVSNPS